MDKIQKIRKEVERIQLYSQSETLSQVLDYIDKVEKEPVSEDLEDAAYDFVMDNFGNPKEPSYKFEQRCFRAGAKWQKEHLWKPADGDDLPEIDREVIVLTQPYPNDEHLRVVFAHRTNKYTKVWNSDLGEEQVVEIERYDKGGWNIPDVKWWLDCGCPNKEATEALRKKDMEK